MPGQGYAFNGARFDTIEGLRAANPGKYYCPICGQLAGRFRDGGVGPIKRKNAKCPECGSLERHRLLWLHLVNTVWPKLLVEKKDCLHIAPEPFFVNILKNRPDTNYVSGDLMMSDSTLKLDLTAIPLWDSKLDLILCSHILEHIPDDRLAMSEMFRVLRPGGILVVMVPTHGERTYEDFSITDPKERKEHFGQEDHVRKYGRDIQERLESCGFDVLSWPTKREPTAEIIDFIACGRRVVFSCQKPVPPGSGSAEG